MLPPYLKNWSSLISYRPATPVQEELYNRHFCFVQPIESGSSAYVSLDYFPVHIYRLPQIARMTAPALLNKIRLELESFADRTVSRFSPRFSSVDSENDTNELLWQSWSPTGAIVHIDMYAAVLDAVNRLIMIPPPKFRPPLDVNINVEDGSVVCGEAQLADPKHSYWTFSTIWQLNDQEHPVSGVRRFGIRQDPSLRDVQSLEFVCPFDGVSGSDRESFLLPMSESCVTNVKHTFYLEPYTFYTMGADRVTPGYHREVFDWKGKIDRMVSREAISPVISAQRQLWRGLQQKVADFVNLHKGRAVVGPIHTELYPWDEVKSQYWHPTVPWIYPQY